MARILPRTLLVIEGVAIAIVAFYLLVLMIVNRPSNLAAALFELVFAALSALVLFGAVKWISLRSAAILLNLIALPISRTLIQGGRVWIAVPVIVLAISTLIALFLDRKTLSELGESPSE